MLSGMSGGMLFIVFAWLIGHAVLRIVPTAYKPVLMVRSRGIALALSAIPLLLAYQLYEVVRVVQSQFSLSFQEAASTVIIQHPVGQSWFVVFTVTVFLGVLLLFPEKRVTAILFFVGVLLLIVSVSWVSHGTALLGWQGFVLNTSHLLASAVWIGTLLMVGWGARPLTDGLKFHRWFSLMVVCAVAVLSVSGLLLMNDIVPEYVPSWALTYGQFLLMKHLLFLPLLLFGLRHLLWLRAEKPLSVVQRSIRIESVVGCVVFFLSAFMTRQTPPHEVAETMQVEPPAWSFLLFHPEGLSVFQQLTLSLTGWGIACLVLAMIGLTASVLSLRHKSLFVFTTSSLTTSLFLYVGLMLSVTPVSILVDETRYPTVEAAIQATYEDKTSIDIVLEDETEETTTVIYTVNAHDFVIEKLGIDSETGDFYRLPAAMLTVGGTSVYDEPMKIRTFQVTDGQWKGTGSNYTYVTFGMIQEPKETVRLQLHYEDGSYVTELTNDVFYHVYESDVEMSQPVIDFLAEDGTKVDQFLPAGVEQGVYCH